MYPETMLSQHCFRYKEMEDAFNEFKLFRINETKPNLKKFKGTDQEQYWKDQDAFAKVILNGLSGMIDMEFSHLYNNKGAMLMRCYGQLVLCYLTERLLEENIEVFMLNTDGASMKIHKNDKEKVEKIIEKVGKMYNFTFENELYKKMIFQNVNSYLAIDTKNNIKQKGEFVTNPELGNSVDELVIAKAINEYFINNVKPEEYIKNNKNIFDFCYSQKVAKKYDVVWTNSNLQTIKCQNMNRYYASTKNGYLKKVDNGKSHHLLKDSGVTIYNNHLNDFPNDVNYKHYINRTNEKIINLKTKIINKTLFE